MTQQVGSPEHEWGDVSAQAERSMGVSSVLGLAADGLGVVLALWVATTVATGIWRYAVTALVFMVLMAPMIYVMWHRIVTQQVRSRELAASLERRLLEAIEAAQFEAGRREIQARRREFETRLSNALEMADGEPEVIGAVERAFAATLGQAPVELLLADNSHAHLVRVAASPPDREPPMCQVDSPDQCPAARRAQVQRFPDSEALDACQKLRGRVAGECAAVCVPVSIMGRTVGVIHATGTAASVLDDTTVQDLSTLANLAGARIGLLRMMAETQLQAATDSLTGLLNRRSLENKVRAIRANRRPLAVAIADLDHFKELNDTYGHETGDRSLRLFAQTLRALVRRDDLVGRHGGEEFAIVLPGSTVEQAQSILEQVRAGLADALRAAGLPPFTASFGLVESSDADEDLATVLTRADVALFDAKHQGRDRIVVHGSNGAMSS
jgi:diguanylate cyclase (GGDEF)-like protein